MKKLFIAALLIIGIAGIAKAADEKELLSYRYAYDINRMQVLDNQFTSIKNEYTQLQKDSEETKAKLDAIAKTEEDAKLKSAVDKAKDPKKK
jgi:uncharacterized protein YlxW (UPF0749 family)